MATCPSKYTVKKDRQRDDKADTQDEIDSSEYLLRKRLPRKLPRRKNDVYISQKTNFPAQLAKCEKLLNSGSEIYIHGLSAAINRAMTLALQLQAKGMGTVGVAASTSTVELFDDLEPIDDDNEGLTQSRYNSAIHIKVYHLKEKT